MAAAESRWLRGITEEDYRRYWQQMLHTTSDDLLALYPVLESLADGGVCIAAGEDRLARLTSLDKISGITS